MTQDAREHLIMDALYHSVDADFVERAEEALSELIKERDRLRETLTKVRTVVFHSTVDATTKLVTIRKFLTEIGS